MSDAGRRTVRLNRVMSSIFLCHSARDKAFVRELAKALDAAGVRVWLDEAEIRIGDSLTKRIGDAIGEMEYFAVVLSRHSVKSEWVQRELQVAMQRELKQRKVVVLPVLLETVEPPPFLRDKLYADFTSRRPAHYRSALSQLISTVLGASPQKEARSKVLDEGPNLRVTAEFLLLTDVDSRKAFSLFFPQIIFATTVPIKLMVTNLGGKTVSIEEIGVFYLEPTFKMGFSSKVHSTASMRRPLAAPVVLRPGVQKFLYVEFRAPIEQKRLAKLQVGMAEVAKRRRSNNVLLCELVALRHRKDGFAIQFEFRFADGSMDVRYVRFPGWATPKEVASGKNFTDVHPEATVHVGKAY